MKLEIDVWVYFLLSVVVSKLNVGWSIGIE